MWHWCPRACLHFLLLGKSECRARAAAAYDPTLNRRFPPGHTTRTDQLRQTVARVATVSFDAWSAKMYDAQDEIVRTIQELFQMAAESRLCRTRGAAEIALG